MQAAAGWRAGAADRLPRSARLHLERLRTAFQPLNAGFESLKAIAAGSPVRRCSAIAGSCSQSRLGSARMNGIEI
jgi:hypothetical protein